MLISSDRLCAKLYLAAPKSLFVFPKYDMDQSMAMPILKTLISASGSTWPKKAGKGPAQQYPKKNEPVLLVAGDWILTADGLIYEVRIQDLVLQPSGSIPLPAKPRVPQCKWAPSVASTAKEDQRPIKAYRNALKRYGKCADRVWAPYGRRIRRLPSFYRDRRLDIRNIGESRVFRVCRKARLNRHQNRLWAKLIKSRTRRRAQTLKVARARLTKLFR